MDIQTILSELYAIDPTLKEHESALTTLVTKLLESRPTITVDESFAASLRVSLAEKARQMEADRSLSFWHRPLAWGSLTALAILAVLGFSLFVDRGDRGELAVADLPDRAFGPLALGQPTDGHGGELMGEDAISSFRQDVAIGSATQNQGSVVGPLGNSSREASGGTNAKISMPVPEPGRFSTVKYVYGGEDFSIEESESSVYRRKINDTRWAADALVGLSAGLADLSKLSNPAVNEFSLSEQRENGYTVSVNLREGIASIYQNWETWPVFRCQAIECERLYSIERDQLPKDDELVSIAQDFLRGYGVSLESYGQGRVQPVWGVTMAQSQQVLDGRIAVPVDVPIVFPLLIDGREVSDEWGNPVGMFVGVNARLKKVTSVQNIAVLNYERSNYTIEQDAEKIKAIALRGGLYENPTLYYPMISESMSASNPSTVSPGNPGIAPDFGVGESITVTLGTPIKAVVQMTRYQANASRPETLYVPALSFPVVDVSQPDQFYRDRIVVPIVTEIIEQYQSGSGSSGGGIIKMMEVEGIIKE